MTERAGMTYAEIDAAFAARALRLEPWNVDFLDGNRPLDLDEVLALLPDATEEEICSWAEDRSVTMRQTVPAPTE